MRKITYILLFSLAFTACKDKTKFVINGKLTNTGTEKKVYLSALVNNRMQLIDSTLLGEKGEFKFEKVGSAADFYTIKIANNEYILIAQNGEEINLTADLTHKDQVYNITGAPDADKLMEFNQLKSKFSAKIALIQAEFEKKSAENPNGRDALIATMRPKYEQELSNLNNAAIKFAKENTNSLVSFYAISMLNPAGNELELAAYAEKIDPKLKNNTAVKAFVDKILAAKNVQIGAIAPDFTINGIDGKPIKLADFKGKYVLIDFWASWCGPCRQENPNVVKAFNKFKARNFTILGISLDKDKQAWAKAIQEDGLTWTHASELSDFDGATVKKYLIEAIPSSFLLDPAGKIIAKNLRGDELEAFLNKTLP